MLTRREIRTRFGSMTARVMGRFRSAHLFYGRTCER